LQFFKKLTLQIDAVFTAYLLLKRIILVLAKWLLLEQEETEQANVKPSAASSINFFMM
jgi:hypothetical protein